ncbi:NACHT domain-containing protein [Dactylosporangium salmoneum]|uniref:NACHT domain-containing protein n=1 Tax=Dactylosporangium salmoneum TaxID=53361 RepID=A0ABP5SNB2_9ACTN
MPSPVVSVISAIAAKAASWAGTATSRQVERHRHERDARTLGPAEDLVERLSPNDLRAVLDYANTPAFEQLALQTMVHVHHERHREPDDEFLAAMREQVRLGLRARASFSQERLITATDAVCGILLEQIALARLPEHAPPNALRLSAGARIATMAVRNSKLLACMEHHARIADKVADYRRQVAALQGKIRFPHAGTIKPVPWEALYVEPELDEPPQTFAELTAPGRRTVILGDPGAGKSTIALHLAFLTATNKAETTIPFVVILRDFVEELRRGHPSLLDCIVKATNAPYGVPMDAETVEYLLLNARCVVLVDGLDEVTDPRLRSRVADLVDGFAHLFPLVPLVATSRRIGYSDAPLDPDLFGVVRIMPFNRERAEAYVGKWFSLVERSEFIDPFLRESRSVADLRSNPLMLSLLCVMYASEQYLPRNRAQVYERCATMMFERWDVLRGVRRQREFDGRVRGAVQELAWHLFTGRVLELRESAAIQVLARYLTSRRFDPLDAHELAVDVLELCANRAWVLTELGTHEGEAVYGFAHRTFLEYFVAERIVRTHVSPEEVWEIIAPHLDKPEWRVVTDLILQLLDRNIDGGADHLVELALDRGDEPAMWFAIDAAAAVSLAPPAVDAVVEWTVERSLRLSLVDRTPFGNGSFAPAHAADAPLRQLVGESLDGNLPRISRALMSSLDRRAAAGDATAVFIGMHIGTATDSSLWNAREAEFAQRWSDTVQGRIWAIHREAKSGWTAELVDRLFAESGPPAFFSYRRVLQTQFRPVVESLLRGFHHDSSAAVRLCRLLVKRRGPWVAGELDPPPAGVLASSVHCVLGLPYLEKMGGLAPSLEGADPEVLGFLMDWEAGAFSVISDPAAAEPHAGQPVGVGDGLARVDGVKVGEAGGDQ